MASRRKSVLARRWWEQAHLTVFRARQSYMQRIYGEETGIERACALGAELGRKRGVEFFLCGPVKLIASHEGQHMPAVANR